MEFITKKTILVVAGSVCAFSIFVFIVVKGFSHHDDAITTQEPIKHEKTQAIVSPSLPIKQVETPIVSESAKSLNNGAKTEEDFIKASEEMAKEYELEINRLEKSAKLKQSIDKNESKEGEEKLPPKAHKVKKLSNVYTDALTMHGEQPINPYVKTIVYHPDSRPILAFAPMQVGQVHLQKGERITNISLGDTDRWLLTQSYVGDEDEGHVLILLKPKKTGIVTNLVVITNRRIYNFNVVAKSDVFSPDVRFIYPASSINSIVNESKVNHQKLQARYDQAHNKTVVDTKHLNFNYTISGDRPSWEPEQAFDDGVHTFIAFSPMVDRVRLPVLFVYINGEPAMVNYRYQRPYIIVDRLFAHAQLVSGKGKNRSQVEIFNKNIEE